jgi:large subunit ribosomal protein L21e
VNLKRQPAQPREARTISTKENAPETLAPIAYDTYI